MNRGDVPGAAGPGPEPPSHFAVVIFGDGTATIDGDPVAVVPGEPLDVAILDMLHGYARARNAPVTGAITDPSADYVAIVEVGPDGSSKLLEQVGDDKAKDEGAGVTPVVAPAVTPAVAPDEPFESGRPRPEPGETRAVPKKSALTTPPMPTSSLSKSSPPKPALSKPPSVRPAVLIGDSSRKKSQSQSDDEYEQPSLFQRPSFIGGVAAAVAALVIGSLVALGSGGSAGAEGNSAAAGSGNDASKSPMALKPPSSSAPAWIPPSPSTSPSTSASPSPSTSPSPSASTTKPAPPKPQTVVKPTADKPKPKPKPSTKPVSGPKMPTGDLLIKNKKFGSCLDIPGHGKGKADARIQDWLACDPSKTDNQRWILHRTHKGAGTGGSDLYVIRNAKDRMCLDLRGEGAAQVSAPVVEYGCKPTLADNQLWWFDKRSNGTYWIRNQASGDMCLDLSRTDKKSANGGVTLFPCNDKDDHQWSFIKA
ncbi:RICIN domain-containing protein [Streptomyces niveus]|uniref:RICIN domain-containing protein n=1 Tax=Streptomyces niveus TaxID=193462 RepID=UPI0034286159